MQLLASGPSTVKVSEPLTLTCAVSGKLITTTGFRGYWYQQFQGKGLKWMSLIDGAGTTRYAPSLQSRTKVSRDTSKNQFSLHLESPTIADTAVYYCALGIHTVIQTQGGLGQKPSSRKCSQGHLRLVVSSNKITEAGRSGLWAGLDLFLGFLHIWFQCMHLECYKKLRFKITTIQ